MGKHSLPEEPASRRLPFESATIEYKASTTGEVVETVLAFLNTAGGHLYLGITDAGLICGIPKPDSAINSQISKITSNISPNCQKFIQARIITIGTHHVLEIAVAQGFGGPFHRRSQELAPNNVLVRLGPSTRKTDEAQFKQLIIEQAHPIPIRFPEPLNFAAITADYCVVPQADTTTVLQPAPKPNLIPVETNPDYCPTNTKFKAKQLAKNISDSTKFTLNLHLPTGKKVTNTGGANSHLKVISHRLGPYQDQYWLKYPDSMLRTMLRTILALPMQPGSTAHIAISTQYTLLKVSALPFDPKKVNLEAICSKYQPYALQIARRPEANAHDITILVPNANFLALAANLPLTTRQVLQTLLITAKAQRAQICAETNIEAIPCQMALDQLIQLGFVKKCAGSGKHSAPDFALIE